MVFSFFHIHILFASISSIAQMRALGEGGKRGILLGSVFRALGFGVYPCFFLSGASLKGMAYLGCGLLVVGLCFGVFVVAKNKRGEVHSLLEVQC